MSTPAIRRPYVVDGEDEVDMIRLFPLPSGRALVIVPEGSSLRSDDGIELSPAELRMIGRALYDAAVEAERGES